MNYLLVMPKSLGTIEHFNIFPIGLAYVSASLKKGGYNVFTANLDHLQGDTYSNLKQLIRKHDITEQTYHRLKSKYGLMEVNDAKRLKGLEDENRRLKQLVAELTPDT